ncbi:conserved hypothetical protein [uncultured Desulfobacterium sp.]|uniref:Lipoprotein n=1 Tax=uncultured Desulfobacterium sp. TaxID=201089 RepID=A0A445MWT8_9BACT|nr:conserved hypothetical protein [uncultured Desulfobacterium sp.]
MRQRGYIIFIFVLTVVFISSGCGRKKPPFLPKMQMPVKVQHLEATWKDGAFHLKGTVINPEDKKKKTPDISGCRISYAFYTQDDPPCEGCPLDFAVHSEIEGVVVTDKEFSCDVPMKKRKGIHFFKVSLVGENGEKGPLSDQAKVTIPDD